MTGITDPMICWFSGTCFPEKQVTTKQSDVVIFPDFSGETMNLESTEAELSKKETLRRSLSVRDWIAMTIVLLLALSFSQMISGCGRVVVDVGKSHPAVGRKLIHLSLAPLTGGDEAVDLKAVDLKGLSGKVALVNYWGVWCPPCRQEFPHLQKLEQELAADEDFRFLSVSCGYGKEEDLDQLRDQTARFLDSMGANFPTYHDPGMESRTALVIGAGLRGFGYPTTVLLDKGGFIRAIWTGYTPGYETEMTEMARDLLAGSADDAG